MAFLMLSCYELHNYLVSAYITEMELDERKHIKDATLINFLTMGYNSEDKVITTFLVIRLFLSRKTKTKFIIH